MSRALIALLLTLVVFPSSRAAAADHKKPPKDEVERSAKYIAAVMDGILKHHVAAPAGQEMLLKTLQILHDEMEIPSPPDLALRVSSMEWEKRHEFLAEYLIKLGKESGDIDKEVQAAVATTLGTLPGGASVASLEEHRVREQFVSNRYVGVGIALRMNSEMGPQVAELFPGPLARAGGAENDIILKINGEATDGKTLQEVVQMLRGPEGSEITLVLEGDSAKPRTLTFRRGVVDQPSVDGYELIEVVQGPPIAYVRVSRISAAVVQELRKLERQLSVEDVQGLVLDLRRGGRNLHNGVMLADALLDGGEIGASVSAAGQKSYTATPDALFAELPLAVFVNRNTSGTVEWVVAALQDNKRAIVIGETTAGRGYANSSVPLVDFDLVLTLPTVKLLRKGGGSLVAPRRLPQIQMSGSAPRKQKRQRRGVYPDYRFRSEHRLKSEGRDEQKRLAAQILRGHINKKSK